MPAASTARNEAATHPGELARLRPVASGDQPPGLDGHFAWPHAEDPTLENPRRRRHGLET
jgi:hypothetical protein